MAQVAIALAVTAGGMALQYLFAPKTKQPPLDKGKMDDVRVIGSDYGAIIPRSWGKTRQAGNIVFSSGVDHYQVTTGGGGGGGKKSGGGTETTHIYKTSIAIIITRNQINEFLRIWADADLITNNSTVYNGEFQAENASLTGGVTVSSSGSGWNGTGFVTNVSIGETVTFTISSVGNPPLPMNLDPDEAASPYTRVSFFYKSNADQLVTLDTNLSSPQQESFPSTGGLWTVYTVIFNGFVSTVSYESLAGTAPDLDQIVVEKYWDIESFGGTPYRVSGIVNPNIEYPTDVNDPSEYYNYSPPAAKNGGTGTYAIQTAIPGELIRFYTGTETQTADSKIKSWLDARYGAGEGDIRASAMRSISYIVLQDRTLKSNRVENFTFETDTGETTVNAVLEDLFADVGLTSGDYDITATAGLTQIGFLESTKASRRSLVEHLMRYHGFRIGEIDGKVKTILDSFTSIATLQPSVLRAHDENEEMPAFDAEIVLKEEHLIPRETRFSVMQPDLEYHNEAVPSTLFANVLGKETAEYTFPIVDSASAARTNVEKFQLKAYTEDKGFEIWGMPETAKYAIGDVITVPIEGEPRKMRIEKKQMPLPIGKVRFQCVSVSSFVPTFFQDEVTSYAPKAASQYVQSTFPRNSVIFPIQSEAIRNEDEGKLGVYLAVSGRGRGNGDNASLYREMDEDNFVLEKNTVASSPLGLCAGTLGNWASGVGVLDTSNTLDIWFFDDVTLETVLQTDIDRHPHVNLVRVGDEWLQFRTATVQTLEDNSPYRSKWRISNLWRGKYGTAGEIGSHGADEYAAIVTGALLFYPLETADIGETVNLKAVTDGQSVDLAPVASFTFGGSSSGTASGVEAVASEDLAVGEFVSFHLDSSVLKVRKADASDDTRLIDGYVTAAFATGATATVYTEDGSVMTGLSGLTIGAEYFLSETAGALTATAPSTTGAVIQRAGKALSATSLLFRPQLIGEIE